MSLPFVFQTDAGNTDSLLQPPEGPAAPGYKYRLKPAASSSDPSLAQDAVEVLLLRLKPDTQYTATVYPRAPNGAEGRPQAVEFKTSTWSFVKWLQPEFPSANGKVTCKTCLSCMISCFRGRFVVGRNFLEEILDRLGPVSFFRAPWPRLFFSLTPIPAY